MQHASGARALFGKAPRIASYRRPLPSHLAVNFPNSKVHIIPKAGHMWIYGNIPDVFKELKAMMAGVRTKIRRCIT